MTINVGLVGPKVKPNGDTDGQKVNIPLLRLCCDGGTQFDRPGTRMVGCLSNKLVYVGKSACTFLREL